MISAILIANRAGALTLAAPTASTTTIPYQGRLADTSGNPLTGTYAMTFRLYAAASGGSALWTETWTGGTGVHVSAGLFNVMLGTYTPIPQTVVTDNNTLWLGITVGADAEMLPRVQLGSVPFAVQALTVPDGSVTSAKLASGLRYIEQYDGYNTWLGFQQFVANNNWTDVTAQSYRPLTITVTERSMLFITGNITIWAGGPGRAALEVYVDGSSRASPKNETTDIDTVPFSVLVPVEAGVHVVSLKIGSWDNVAVNVGGPIAFNVLAFGQ